MAKVYFYRLGRTYLKMSTLKVSWYFETDGLSDNIKQDRGDQNDCQKRLSNYDDNDDGL